MNTFTLLTILAGSGVVLSFFSGVRAVVVGSYQATTGRRMLFDMAVFLTILAAPLSH